MTDYYRDTDERMRRDPDFAAAVRMLEQVAQQHGFTPGELKQIAFKAALNIEERRAVPVTMTRPCENCGGPVNPLTSWSYQGRRVCSRGCFHDVGGKP